MSYIMGNDKPEGIFKFVITKIGFSRPGYSIWSAEKKEAEQTEEETGIKTKSPQLTFKEHGMSVECFIIEKQIATNQFEEVERDSSNKFSIDILTPDMLYHGEKPRAIGDQIRGGLASNQDLKAKLNKKTNSFIIHDLLPSGYEVKDFASGFTASTIPETHPLYEELRKKEAVRRDAIENITKAWEKFNEEEAYNMLKTIVARRLLLHQHKEDGTYFVHPEPGLTFVAKLVQPYYNVKVAEYNRDEKRFNIYSQPVGSIDKDTLEEIRNWKTTDFKQPGEEELEESEESEESDDGAPF